MVERNIPPTVRRLPRLGTAVNAFDRFDATHPVPRRMQGF